MVWYNPLDWSGDAGSRVADRLTDEVVKFAARMRDHVQAHPEVIVIPVAVGTGVAVAIETGRSFGRQLGTDVSKAATNILTEE